MRVVELGEAPIDEPQLRTRETLGIVVGGAFAVQCLLPVSFPDLSASFKLQGKHNARLLTYLSLLVIDHHVVRLDVAVHNAHTMAVVQSLCVRIQYKYKMFVFS